MCAVFYLSLTRLNNTIAVIFIEILTTNSFLLKIWRIFVWKKFKLYISNKMFRLGPFISLMSKEDLIIVSDWVKYRNILRVRNFTQYWNSPIVQEFYCIREEHRVYNGKKTKALSSGKSVNDGDSQTQNVPTRRDVCMNKRKLSLPATAFIRSTY